MAFYGSLMEEYLQARERLWLHYFGGGLFWPLNNFIQRPIALRPQEIMDDPPPAPADEEEEEEIDVVGLDEEEEPYRPDGEDEEEVELAGLDGEEVLQGAEPRGDDGDAPHRFDRPDSRRGEREEELNDARAPSPPLLQEGPPAPAFAPPIAAPYVNPYAPPFAYPYAPAYAPAYAPVYAASFGYQYAPFAAPLAAPLDYPYFPPYDAHPADPPADVDDTLEFQIPQLEPETLGPLSEEECAELFYTDDSLEEDPAPPSTSGSSGKRRRSESEEESGSASRRPRWSNDSDSD